MDRIQEAIERIVEENGPSAGLIDETVQRMKEEQWMAYNENQTPKKRRSPRRMVIAALAVVLALGLSLGAAAGGFSFFRSLIFGGGDELADSMTELVAVAEDDGFKLEVLGAMRDQNHVVAYYTLTDESGQNRLTENSRAFTTLTSGGEELDIWINDGVYHTEPISFDETTNTALFLFDATGVGEAEQLGLRVYRIRLDEDREYVVTSFQAEDLPQVEGTNLTPGEPVILGDKGYAQTSAVGFIGDSLHIQKEWRLFDLTQSGETVNHGDVTCTPAGEGREMAEFIERQQKLLRPMSAEDYAKADYLRTNYKTYAVDENGELYECDPMDEKAQYAEYTFNVSPSMLNQVEFVDAAYWINDVYLELVTEDLALEPTLPENMVHLEDVTVGGVRLSTVEILPLGLYLTGDRGQLIQVDTVELVIGDQVVECPRVQAGGAYYSEFADMAATASYLVTGVPADLTQLTALRINGEEILLQ